MAGEVVPNVRAFAQRASRFPTGEPASRLRWPRSGPENERTPRNQNLSHALSTVMGGWELPAIPFPNSKAPRLTAGGCERGAFHLKGGDGVL
jgi:hypothetical protein